MKNKLNIKLIQKNTEKTAKQQKNLGLFDLSILGIGAMIGTGILVLTGIVAALDSGPAIVFSFLLAALAAGLIGLCYSELTTSIPSSGSAYIYAWVSIGQFVAFLAGWTLLGVYVTTAATVANGWTGYVKTFLQEFGINLPHFLLASPADKGLINLPAVIMILLITLVLTRGTSESRWINNALVIIKLFVVILFIVISIADINLKNWHPFFPYGASGVFTGASTVFFTFLGFDALATAAEDTKEVRRTLPRAIVISLGVSTLFYIAVSLVMTGVVNYKELNVSESMAYVLLSQGHQITAQIVSAGAILGIMAVVYAFIYAGSNIMMSMGRGGFLPSKWSILNEHTHSPNIALWTMGILAALLAGLFDLHDLAVIANVGSLTVFGLISLIVILLRKQQPDLPRPFKIPFGYLIPTLSIAICIILLISISLDAWITYFIWILLGLILYFLYSKVHINTDYYK